MFNQDCTHLYGMDGKVRGAERQIIYMHKNGFGIK